MAHFAELDSNNIVKQVIVVNNNELMHNGVETESKGVSFLNGLFGHSNWKQTSYNGNMRKHYAGVGYSYDEARDAFIAPKPFDSWTLDDTTCSWVAPVSYPNDDKKYRWDENSLNWVEITENL